MKTSAKFSGAVAIMVLAVAALYAFGLSVWGIGIAVVLLLCPIVVVWQSWAMTRRTDKDIHQLIERRKSD